MSSERSFAKEIELLELGDGDVFQGEGILAVTKALLQSGVSYVGGYQGAPVSHLIDVLVDAEDLMASMGVHVETCTNEASAAAMLGASVNYPMRGAVTWKSIVGTNVASDALSNLASPGVVGGAVIVVGEDYGEGASVIQERTHAFAMKSSMWLLDPRPNLGAIVDMTEHAFRLSEASNTPVFLELRIRACHVQGEFIAKDNVKPVINALDGHIGPANFDYNHLPHPPSTYSHEKLKVTERQPAAQAYIVENGLNEIFDGEKSNVGIVVQGGLYNTLIRRLSELGLADAFGESKVPLFVLNVTHPLVPDQLTDFCAGKDGVLVLEEGNPEFIEHQINTFLRKTNATTRIFGKDVMPVAGEYSAEALLEGLSGFFSAVGLPTDGMIQKSEFRDQGTAALGVPLPPRPPGFCTGCPERPVFSAIKLLEAEIGKVHIAADIGCHAFATFEPFSLGHTILGYGMSLASSAAVSPFQNKRSISIVGDGGFWHNGLNSGVISSLLNRGDSILIIMQNGYTSATGQQFIPNSASARGGEDPGMDIESTLKGLGVKWLKTVSTYSVGTMIETLRDAITTPAKGLKIIIADGECQLARQRRVKRQNAADLKAGIRVALPRFNVDPAVCTGDHACIRLSGCPSLTLSPNPDVMKEDPIAEVTSTCVGCGLCGEAVHVNALCPSFYQTETVMNAGTGERMMASLRNSVISKMAGDAQ